MHTFLFVCFTTDIILLHNYHPLPKVNEWLCFLCVFCQVRKIAHELSDQFNWKLQKIILRYTITIYYHLRWTTFKVAVTASHIHKYKNGYNSIFTDLNLTLNMIVSESHPQHILGVLSDRLKRVFGTWLLTIIVNGCLLGKYLMNQRRDLNIKSQK